MRASEEGLEETCSILLEVQADPNSLGWAQWTALMCAATKADDGVVQTLISAGADPQCSLKVNLSIQPVVRLTALMSEWANRTWNGPFK